MRSTRGSTAAVLVAATLVRCSYADQPDLHPVRPSLLVLLSSQPAPAALGVDLQSAIDLTFNAAPDPSTVGDVDVRLYSGVIEAIGSVKVDLLARRLRMQPFRSLRPALRYQVSLAGTIRALDGAELGSPVVFDFTTGSAEGARPPPPPAVTAADLQPTWSRRCTSCHAGAEPPMGVDLSSPDAARSLRAMPSSAGLLQVVPGDHARSYLVRKLLGEGACLGPPMPPDGPLLDRAELRQVADWIDAGAR